MDRIKVGSKVTITLTGTVGEVIGIYESRDGLYYDVEYADVNKLISSRYFRPEQITLNA